VWEIDPSKHQPGFVLHTLGWPLDHKTYGGSFLYHMKDNMVSGLFIAFVLCYFCRFQTMPTQLMYMLGAFCLLIWLEQIRE